MTLMQTPFTSEYVYAVYMCEMHACCEEFGDRGKSNTWDFSLVQLCRSINIM